MNKSDDRRSEIADQLADYILAKGLPASSLRALADAAKVSDRMLLYYFKDKAEIISTALNRISERMVLLLGAETAKKPVPFEKLRAQLTKSLFDDRMWPYMCVWLEIASLAARNDPFYKKIGEEIGRGFLAWGAAQLDSASPKARDAEAAQLLVIVEGMVLLKSLNLDDVSKKAYSRRR